LEGAALHLTGDLTRARARLEEGGRRGAALAPAFQVLCQGQLALLAIDESDWETAELLAGRARAQIRRASLGDCPTCALVFAVSAAVEARFGRVESSEHNVRDATRLLTELVGFAPWYLAECCIALARAAMRLGDPARARQLLRAAERELRSLPDATVAHDWLVACKADSTLASTARSD